MSAPSRGDGSELRSEIRELYARLDRADSMAGLPNIQPYVGSDYGSARPRIRLMGVGINSYISPGEIDGCEPEWVQAWTRQRAHRFYSGVRRNLDVLGAALQSLGSHGGRYDPDEGIYVTNAVKRYTTEEAGKRSDLVDQRWFEEGKLVWREELRLLAKHGAMPQLIAVFGRRPWWPVASVLLDLCRDPSEPLFERYTPLERGSDAYHRLNVVSLAEGAGAAQVVLLGLNHTAARGSKWNARFALDQDEVRGALGLPGRE